MTVKEFFKSSAFKSIAVLMCIVIVCGGIIAVCNGLFYVSDEEKLLRAIGKIFGKTPEFIAELKLTDEQKTNEYGNIEQAFFIKSDGNNLFIKATGKSEFASGSVTTWVAVTAGECNYTDSLESAVITGIGKVRYEDDERQTLMSKFDDKYYAQFSNNNASIAAGGYFTASGGSGIASPPVASATYSSKAIVGSVNAALCYARGGVS